MNKMRTLFLMMLLLGLTACGGGGGSVTSTVVTASPTTSSSVTAGNGESSNTGSSTQGSNTSFGDTSDNTINGSTGSGSTGSGSTGSGSTGSGSTGSGSTGSGSTGGGSTGGGSTGGGSTGGGSTGGGSTGSGSTGGDSTGSSNPSPQEPVFAVDTGQNRSFPLTWLPDGSLLLGGNRDNVFKVWEGRYELLKQAVSGHTDWVLALTATADSRLLASGGRDASLRFWVNTDGKIGGFGAVQTETGGIRSLSFSPSGTFLAVAGSNGNVQLWEYSRRQLQTSWQAHTGITYTVRYSPDGQMLASGGADGQVRLWNTFTGEKLTDLGSHDGAVYQVVFSADGRQLISTGGDGQIKRWDIAGKRLLGSVGQHDAAIYALALAADGVTLASGDTSGAIGIWRLPDLETKSFAAKPVGSVQQMAVTGSGAVHALAFDPVSGQLAASYDDAMIRIWDVVSGQLQRTMASAGAEGPPEPEAPEPTDNSPEISRQLAALVLDGMKPVLATPDLLAQPERLTNVFLQGINQTTLACPQGNYQYTFTDANADKRYASANDDFAVNVAQCGDGDLVMTGSYGLRLHANIQDLDTLQTETAVRLTNLLMDNGLTPATLTGNLDIAVTEPLDGINPSVAVLTANQLGLEIDSIGTYSFSSLLARLETDPTTGEDDITYNAQLALQAIRGSLVSSGDYVITTLEPVLLSSFESYPYAGKLRIQHMKPRASGQITVISVLNSQKIKLETDKGGNGVTDHVQTLSWKNLIQPFQ